MLLYNFITLYAQEVCKYNCFLLSTVHQENTLHYIQNFLILSKIKRHSSLLNLQSSNGPPTEAQQTLAARLQWLCYGSSPMATLLWQLCNGSSAIAALLWQLYYSSNAPAAMLRQLCYASYGYSSYALTFSQNFLLNKLNFSCN